MVGAKRFKSCMGKSTPKRGRACVIAGAGMLLPVLAHAADAPPAPPPAPPRVTAPAAASAKDMPAPDIVVTARRLDSARDAIRASLGASTYALSAASIANIPGGENQPLSDIILQLPGISQDQFGQFHVRDDHNGLEYRLNGVVLPEGIAVFGQSLSPQLIDKLELITGALPAQYGLHTAGIIDITSRRDVTNGGSVGLYGGSFGTIQPTAELHGGSGNTSYFLTASYTHNSLGIDNVSASRDAIHDRSDSGNVFGYVDHILGSQDRVALTFGYTAQHYQIPNPAGLQPANGYVVNGVSAFPSEGLDERQRQSTSFAVVNWLHNGGDITWNAAVTLRQSSLDYLPDALGELLYNGIAQSAQKRDLSLGAQIDASWQPSAQHTIRAGAAFANDHSVTRTASTVLPTDASAHVPAGAAPFAIDDATSRIQRTYSVYVQDEWQLGPRLTLNYGARFDDNFGLRHEDQLSPRANLVFKPSPATTFHAGYARYFALAPFELVAGQTIAALANTTAAPPGTQDTIPFAERQNYFDVGVLQKITPRLSLGVDGYYRRSTNLIDEGQFGAPIILTPFNYASGLVRGVELTANYARGGLTLYGNLAWAKATGQTITSSQFNFAADELATIAAHAIHLDHDQTWTGSGGVAYKFGAGRLAGLHLSADMIYGSGLRTDLVLPNLALPNGGNVPNGASLRPYATVNASVGYKIKAAGLDLRLDVVNLLDRVYEIRDGMGVGVGAPSYGERRGVFAGVTKKF